MSKEPNYRKQCLLKNCACLSICLALIFITSVFVSESYFSHSISETVRESSLLKEYLFYDTLHPFSAYYEDWGSMQNPSPVINKFTPFEYSKNGKASLSNESVQYQYSFKYQNISFALGNIGTLKYLNEWERTFDQQLFEGIVENNQEGRNLNVLNIDAEKVYNYDYFAPNSRKFALMYNILFDMLSKEFLTTFYSYYIFEYFFNNQVSVQKRVFTPIGISEDKGKSLYTHLEYGLNNPTLLQKWISLSEQTQSGEHALNHFYWSLKNSVGLTQKQIAFIVGPQSTLYSLLTAVKGSIKYKLWSRQYGYECESEFCSKEEIAASQIAMGFLTKDGLFKDLNLDKYTNELNNTLFSQIEYSAFCDNNPDMQCLDGASSLQFFIPNYLSNYTEVDFLMKNADKPEMIESRYALNPGTGSSIVSYMKYLFENVFNIKKDNNDQQIDYEALKQSFTNYNHIQKTLDNFQQILFDEMYSRAFYNKFASADKKTCENYYTGKFEQYKVDCKIPELNITSGIESARVYIEAYLGRQNSVLFKKSTMSKQLIGEFLFSSQDSLFVTEISELSDDLKEHFNCTLSSCNSHELMTKEWKDGSILSNLPQKYFAEKNISIVEWDTQNLLNGIEPQLFKYMEKVDPSLDPSQVLNSADGIYSLFNLMKVFSNRQASSNTQTKPLFSGISNSDLLSYLQSMVLDVSFDGVYLKKKSIDMFNGYNSTSIEQKRQMNNTLGGASWLNPQVSLIKLQNKPIKFNTINTGIYDSNKIRQISIVEESQHSSSQYQSYKSKYQNVKEVFVSDKRISGTNLFGFQSQIQQFQSIEAYLDITYSSQTLIYRQSMQWKDTQGRQITVFKFQFPEDVKPVSTSVEDQSNRTVELSSESYFLVEPETGLTMEMYIKYNVATSPYYLSLIKDISQASFPIYQGEVKFINQNTDKIVQIYDQKRQLSILTLVAIILGSLSMLLSVVSLIFFKRTSDQNEKIRKEKRSLLSSQAIENSDSGVFD